MKATTEKTRSSETVPKRGRPEKQARGKRLGWFLLIWALSVAAIATVGYGLRAVIEHIYGG